MSDRKRSLNKLERNVSPDSTTQFFEGEEVFVQNNDQFILGKIKAISVATEKCLVNIDSGESSWVFFKDLKPWTIDIDESSIKCNVCKNTQSKKNNVVVTCEICFRGYHQKCHQPVIESLNTCWICKKCNQKQNCHFIETRETQKTATFTSKDLILPRNFEEITYSGKIKCIRNSVPAQLNTNAFKGQKVCIKSASPPFNDEQRKTTSKVKKKKSPIENKTSFNSSADNTLPELPPTPPSSISAPETPQTLSMNGEAPLSPNDEVTCLELRDNSPINIATCRLEELFNILEKPPPSDVTFPVQLNPVIMHPLMRTTKRHLSEKDIDIVGGVITFKRRRRFRRQNNLGTRQIGQNSFLIPSSPLKNVHTSPKGDLKTQVYGYYDEVNKKINREETLNKFGSGSEYRICGKRKTIDGQVQYLVEWVQCSDPL